jgi:hypothetical protein
VRRATFLESHGRSLAERTPSRSATSHATSAPYSSSRRVGIFPISSLIAAAVSADDAAGAGVGAAGAGAGSAVFSRSATAAISSSEYSIGMSFGRFV